MPVLPFLSLSRLLSAGVACLVLTSVTAHAQATTNPAGALAVPGTAVAAAQNQSANLPQSPSTNGASSGNKLGTILGNRCTNSGRNAVNGGPGVGPKGCPVSP